MKLNSSLSILYIVCIVNCSTGAERLQCPKESFGGWPFNRVNTTQRLIWLRNEMGRMTSVRGPILNAYIITSDDEHQSEYLAEADKKLQYISGFSGQYGYAVVTRTAAALWTTEKYYDLADQQLDCNWELMKLGDPGVPSIADWLKRVLKRALFRVGGDPKMISSTVWEEWNRELAADKLALIEVNNLIDLIWTIGRPSQSPHPAFVLPPEYAGETWQIKVEHLRQNLSRFGCDAMIVTGLEEIAWLLNIRGRDMAYNPFVKAYLIVERDLLRLYIPKEKISDSLRRQLKLDVFGNHFGIRTVPYEMVFNDLRTLSQAWSKVLIPTAWYYTPGASQAILTSIPPDKRFLRQSPIILMKAKKNSVEIEGMRKANLRDSAAFIDFIAHMEEEMKAAKNWTEMDVVSTLESYRKDQNLSQGIAFPTSAAFAHHGALFYYEPTNKTNKKLDDSSTLIIEGGGHYYDGTSDVIRTFHFGTPTQDMIEAYTTMLSALIQLTIATFPAGAKSTDLDTVIRSKLWKAGINYRMDLGHGLGSFSNIRESPVMINSDSRQHRQNLKEGYFLTCEPSYRKPYRYGVKLGNVLEVVTKAPTLDNKFSKYLGLREVSLVPFEPKLIDTSMLSKEEMDWLNGYHLRVMQEVGAELKRQSRMQGFYWLMEKTKEIPYNCNFSLTILPSVLIVVSCTIISLLH